jgi:hypothetical protein
MLRVVRICIKVPSRCRSVKRAAGRSLLRPPTLQASLTTRTSQSVAEAHWGPVLRQSPDQRLIVQLSGVAGSPRAPAPVGACASVRWNPLIGGSARSQGGPRWASVVSEAHDQGPQPVPRYLNGLNGRDKVAGPGEEARAQHDAAAHLVLGGLVDLAVLDDRRLGGSAAHFEGDEARQGHAASEDLGRLPPRRRGRTR